MRFSPAPWLLPARGSADARRSSRMRRWLGIVLSTVLVTLGLGSTASAAVTAGMTVSITPTATPVLAGDDMSWLISWSCSSIQQGAPCDGAKIVVPIPTSVPSGIAPTVKSVTRDANGYVASATINASQAVWTFQPSVTGGASGQVVMVLQSRNLMTPNGETYTPIATVSGTNIATSMSNTDATVTVNATPSIKITKDRMPGSNPGPPEPYAGDLVTYRIVATNGWPLTSATPNGTESLQNMVVTDQLAPTAIFVKAERLDFEGQTVAPCTVSGQDGNGQGGLVTCPPINDPLGTGINRRGQTVYVTVRFPLDQLTSNTPADQSDDGVTNTATVHAEPYKRAGVDVTASASYTHGFRTRTSGSPGVNVTKGNNSQGVVYQGQTSVLWTNQAYNTGTTPLAVHWVDRLPCGYTSPTTSPSPCANPTNTIQALTAQWGYRTGDRPVTATVTYLDGTTGTHTWSGVETTATAVWSLPKPGVEVRWDAPLEPREVFNVTYRTTVASTLPVPNPDPAGTPYLTQVNRTDGNTYLENCLSDGWWSVDGSTTTAINFSKQSGLGCAVKQVLPATPLCNTNCAKLATNATQAPKGNVDFTLVMQNTGTGPMHPQILDLLPPQLKVLPGSVVFPLDGAFKEPNYPRGSLATVEVIDNYAGTGRQLLRITWPDSQVLRTANEGVGTYQVKFKTTVQGGYPAGGYSNTVLYGDRDHTDICIAANRVVDVHDLDGDGSTTDTQCKASANFFIAELGGIDINKAVKGEADAAFMAPPSVGHTSPDGSAQWQVNIVNAGSVNLTSAVAYDILPDVGDQATGPAVGARESEWRNYFTGIASKPDTVSVEYSASTNPCRGEVLAQGGSLTSGPANCTNDWTATPPSDLSTVRALRFLVTDPAWVAGKVQTIVYNVKADPNATGTSWNTASVAARRDIGWLQPTESPRTGLVVPIDLDLKKRIISSDPHVVGSKVTYRLVLTNNGPGHATGVKVTDALPAGLTFSRATPSQGTYAVSTGVWDVGQVNVGQVLTLDLEATVGTTATPGLINFAQVTGADQPDSDSTPGNGTVNPPHEDDESEVPLNLASFNPSVSLTKSTNGVDANVAPGPLVPFGSPVAWTYLVQNTGMFPLINIAVTDDKGVTVSCPKTRLEPSDGATGGPDEMTCTGSGTATAGQYANIGTVVATGTDGPGTVFGPAGAVTDTDPSHYFGSNPSIGIVKKINGDDANAAPGVATTFPGTMTTTFVVTNTGNVALDEVVVTDNVLGTTSTIVCPKSALAVGEEMTCTTTSASPAPGTQHHDVATASGRPPTPASGVVPAKVTGTDGAYAHSTPTPSVTIRKYVEGQDADEAPGPEVVSGSPMHFTFVVTNTGNTALTSVTVTDPALSNISCPSTSLIRGGSVTCTATLTAPAPGQAHHNTATVTGTPATPEGTAIQGQGDVTDSNDANAYAVQPGLQIVKRINGADANLPRGVAVLAGSTMQVSFFVVNTGTQALASVVVTDDTIPTSEISCPTESLSAWDGAPGGADEMTCTATLPAPSAGAEHKNVASVEAQPLLNGEPSGDPVSDSDPAHAWTAQPGIAVVKTINGEDADAAPGVTVAAGAMMTVSFAVSNTGDTVLTDVTVTDDVLPAASISCPSDRLAPRDADAGGPDEMICTAVLQAPEPGVPHRNLATASGQPAQDDGTPIEGSSTVQSQNPAHAQVEATPAISVVKKINGDDANDAPGVLVDATSTMAISFEVSNDGNTPLTAVVVTDDVIPSERISCPRTTLGVGGTMTCTATWTAPAAGGQHKDTATVVGLPSTLGGTPLGLPEVTWSDSAHAHVAKAETPPPPTDGPSTAAPPSTPAPGTMAGWASTLAHTGGELSSLLIAAAMLLLAGCGLILVRRRRPQK